MAGSYLHAVDDEGRLRNVHNIGIATENDGDSWETLEEMYGMIWLLAVGDPVKVEWARQHYKAGLELSPGHEDPHHRAD